MNGAPIHASLEGVTKSFGDRPVLEGVDLEVPAGGITVVMGGSGSGKTTAMRLLLGLEEPDRGRACLFGQEVSHSGRLHNEQMLRIGALFQFGALFDSMTVAENVGFALRYVRGLGDAEIASRVRDHLLMVGLKDIEHLYPAQLSGGMRKRVALARAIAHEPELLMVDEPTTGLDPIMKNTIVELILQMRDRLGVTVLCITHDVAAAFRMADHMAMLIHGRVAAAGDPQSVRESPDEAVRQFLSGGSFGPIEP
ncbi:MAG: ATP-binding cassette domain-containing protein [Myxococcota bacterium]|nr:ATP-binding cassette domain-containing protein [Myxococcota bacterium]